MKTTVAFAVFFIFSLPVFAQESFTIYDFENPDDGMGGFSVQWSESGTTIANRIDHPEYGGVVELNCESTDINYLEDSTVHKIGFANDKFYNGWSETVEGAEFITVDVFFQRIFLIHWRMARRAQESSLP